MSYTLATLWFDRHRYIPGILAVGFSALLIALQCGLLVGLLSVTSIPIDRSQADIWFGSPKILSVDVNQPISENFAIARLGNQPEVVQVEPYILRFGTWEKPNGGADMCIIVGSRLSEGSLGAVDKLTPDLRMRLTEPDTIVVDESELERLDVSGVGDSAKILGRKVKIVGLVSGMKSIAGPYVFCSLPTARSILRYQQDQATYVLARCRNPEDAPLLVQRLREEYNDNISAYTKPEFSRRSRMHWLTKTKAGIALGYAAALGLLVGAVVTVQTLYAATMASMREYATLLALGIPRRRLAMTVLLQAFWIGILGIAVSLPATFGLAELAGLFGVRPYLPIELLAGAGAITLFMAMLAGVIALRSIRQIEPVNLLR
ncbi:MAG TPA: ABC transporter permease [Gemmataceae bacterium]|nr:ABC transporter permease [Gemmataceae bacterium]